MRCYVLHACMCQRAMHRCRAPPAQTLLGLGGGLSTVGSRVRLRSHVRPREALPAWYPRQATKADSVRATEPHTT